MHPADDLRELEHIGYYRAPKTSNIRPALIRDDHEYIELLTAGKVRFDDGSGEREVGCGTLFWHKSGEYTIHKNNPDDPYECLTVLFKIPRPHKMIAPKMTFWDAQDAKSFAEEALRAFHDESVDRWTLCRYVHSRLLWAAHSFARSKQGPGMPPALERAMMAIDRGFNKDLKLDEIALEAGVSVPYLHALFKRHLDEAPHQTLLARRLREAKNLLASSDLNLKTIGFNCGFASVEHFCRVFKGRFGATPTEYRLRHTPTAILRAEPRREERG